METLFLWESDCIKDLQMEELLCQILAESIVLYPWISMTIAARNGRSLLFLLEDAKRR
jgi:hypothetical protein